MKFQPAIASAFRLDNQEAIHVLFFHSNYSTRNVKTDTLFFIMQHQGKVHKFQGNSLLKLKEGSCHCLYVMTNESVLSAKPLLSLFCFTRRSELTPFPY